MHVCTLHLICMVKTIFISYVVEKYAFGDCQEFGFDVVL